MNAQSKPDIFISYSHKDVDSCRELMRELCPLAEKEGLIIFTDRDDIHAGDPFHETIIAALRDMRLFVFLASPNSARSNYIKKYELPIAQERKLEGTIGAVPVLFSDVPGVDAWGWLWRNQFAGVKPGDDLPSSALDKTQGVERAERIAAIAADIIWAAKKAPARGRPGASSEIVALRCNRTEQVLKFEQSSRPHSAVPAAEVWLLPGNEDDLPGYLGRRLYVEHVWSALQGKGTAAASQNPRFFPWPNLGASEARILSNFARALAKDDVSGSVISAKTVAGLLHERAGLECLHALQSDVHVKNEETANLEQIQRFLTVLGSVMEGFGENIAERPKIYVFLSILLPGGGGFLSQLLSRRDKRMLKQLGVLCGDAGPCATHVTPKLRLVERTHVKDWYKDQIANDDGESTLLCDEIFHKKAALPMDKVVHRLKEEHSKFQRKYQ